MLCIQGDSWGRLVRDQEVGGSNPLAPTNLFKHFQAQSKRTIRQCRRICRWSSATYMRLVDIAWVIQHQISKQTEVGATKGMMRSVNLFTDDFTRSAPRLGPAPSIRVVSSYVKRARRVTPPMPPRSIRRPAVRRASPTGVTCLSGRAATLTV